MKSPLKIGDSGFGWVVVNGTRYNNDLIFTTDAQVIPRPKHLSKKYGGWHTVLGPEEVESALAGNPEILLAGCGQFGLLPIRDETRALLVARGIQIQAASTPNAIARYEELAKQGKRVAAVLHVTC